MMIRKYLFKVQRKIIGKLIRKCFAGVTWHKQRFISNGVLLTTAEGEDKFYSAKEIDRAVRKLDRLLRLLSKG